MPAAVAPFVGLAEAGCSAAAGGLGAVTTQPPPRGRRPRIGPSAGCGRERQSFQPQLCGEKVIDGLGLGTSAGTGNLEDSLAQSGQRVAADGAALASVLALSLLAAAVLSSTV